MGKPTHTLMSHNLAKALMESGMQHFDIGGGVVGGGLVGSLTPQANYMAGLNSDQMGSYLPTANAAGSNALAGYGNFQNIQSQQQDLANALLAQSHGQGPNPAQAQLAQNTGANVAGQAALMAGQRGAGSNVGLLARQAAQQGAGIQQNAVGQAATLQAQQQIAAQQALAQQQAAMQGANAAEQGVNSSLFGAAAGANNAQNNSIVATQDINAQTARKNAEAEQKTSGGILGGIGSFLSKGLGMIPGVGAIFKYEGGEIPNSSFPEHLHSVASIYHPEFAHGGGVNFTAGGGVPGHAEVAGNSVRNDTVPALVSPGEIVLPRTVTQAADAPKRAAEFVRHLQEKEDAQTGYRKIAESKKRKAA